MAQDPSIEAARARIQRLVEEIAGLSRKEMRSEEYFQEFLTRAVQATDARGGAVWLVGQRSGDGKSEFQLAAQVEFDSSQFHSNEAQHAFLLRQLTDTVQSKKAIVAAPEPAAPTPGSLQAQLEQIQGNQPAGSGNKTPYPFFHLPLTLKDQVLGVLQVWLQPYVTTDNYAEFVTFLATLAGHAEQHFHSRRVGNLVLENQRLQQVLKFASDIAGSLDPLEVARLAANYGRDLIGCERCSILTLKGDRWSVAAISGQETVEKKSAMVKSMVGFVEAHARPDAFLKRHTDPQTGAEVTRHELVVLSKKGLLEVSEGGPNGSGAVRVAGTDREAERADLAYLEHSHVVSAAVAPMFDSNQELVGAMFAESISEGFFDAPAGPGSSGPQRLTEWLAQQTGKGLQAAQDYRSLPFLAVTSRLRATHQAFTGRKRKRVIFRTVVAGIILAAIALYPKMLKVDGNCGLVPKHRAAVVPEVGGRVDKVLVREGTRVTKGQPIAQLDVRKMELELEANRAERFRWTAEADRLRGLGDEAQGNVAAMQAVISEKNAERLQADIAAATLRSPIDGVVLTKDLEVHAGEFLQPGVAFAEVAALDAWELQVEVNEKQIGKIEKELASKGKPLPINFILYSQSAHKLEGWLESERQISAMAYPREKENVFIITLPRVDAPPEVKNDFRPGLTGRAKVGLHREPLAVWFFKELADWLRLKLIR
jgi:hypothetical protein